MDDMLKERILRLRSLEKTYTIFCQGTKQVFITCDEETYEDQVWIFAAEDQAKAFALKRAEEKQDMLMVAVLENRQLLQFYGNLYYLGVTELVFTEGDKTAKIPLESLVGKPDYSKLPPERRPLMNPQMQLTGIYFMQEMHRRLPNQEKPKLRELEEEMAVNLVRSRFLMAMEVQQDAELRIPCVKNKEGRMFQPLFTDHGEYTKFDREKKFRPMMVEFVNIEKVLGKNIEGIVVNPQSINMIIPKDRIPMLLERFGGQE